MKIQLERPIAFIDIEATGLDLNTDRIVELSICKLHPDGARETKTSRFNPERPIPPEVTEIHGIKDEDVANEPTFKQKAKAILEFISGCDLAGFNSNRFDIPLLYNEMARAGLKLEFEKVNMIDVGNIFKIQEPRTLEAAAKFYLGYDLTNAHSAEADVNATVEVFLQQLQKYPEMPKDLAELARFSNYGSPVLDLQGKFIMNDKGVILLNFGKYKGQPATDHPDFLEWMLYKADFPADTCRIAREILQQDEELEEEEDDDDFI